VWKIEGLDLREDCEKIVAMARRDGRKKIGCIILGRGSDEQSVLRWLKTAADVPGFIGFAVGRTTWWEAMAAWRAKVISSDAAISQIAQRFSRWAEVFEQTPAFIRQKS
jgi:myo-inositol catabolism protein IolC